MDRRDHARILGFWAVLVLLATQAITPNGNSLSSSWLLRFVGSDLPEIKLLDSPSAPMQEPDNCGDSEELCTLSLADDDLRPGCDSGRFPQTESATIWSVRDLIAPNPFRGDWKKLSAVEGNAPIRDVCRLLC